MHCMHETRWPDQPSKLETGDAGRDMKSSVSDFGAIGFALAGFTFWVLGDSSIKLMGQSRLPA